MAAITFSELVSRRDALMQSASRVAVLINKPDATSDATAAVFLVKDPDPGDAPVTAATSQACAKGGDTGVASSWKSYSYAALGTAYSL